MTVALALSMTGSASFAGTGGVTGDQIKADKGGGVPDVMPPKDAGVQAGQAPLMDLANQTTTEFSASAAWAGLELDPPSHAVKLYWVGTPTPDLSVFLASNPDLELVPGKFGLAAVKAAADEIGALNPTLHLEIAGISVANNGDGLAVQAVGAPSLSDVSKSTDNSQLMSTLRQVAARHGVGIATKPVVIGSDSVPGGALAYGRQTDTSPFWGSAVALSSNNDYCSTGFGMHATGDPNAWFLLLNAHCAGFVNGHPFTTGSGGGLGTSDFIGLLYNSSVSYDLGVIRMYPGATSGAAFYTTGETGYRYVNGYAGGGMIMNATYCVSGVGSYLSGQPTPNCNLLTTQQYKDCTNYPGGKCVWLIGGKTTNGAISYCHGDSSGPIYYTDGSGATIAAGLATAIYPQNPATSTASGPANCYMWFGSSVVATAVKGVPGLAVNVH